MTNKFFTIINPVRRVLICLLLLFMDPIVRAESFLGLEPLEPLSSVKQRFSAGALTVEPADWLKPNQYFVKMPSKTSSTFGPSEFASGETVGGL